MNSNFEFKRDYLNTHTFPSSYGVEYQPLNTFSNPKPPISIPPQTHNLQSVPVYSQPVVSQVVNRVESNINKSIFNNEVKTEINSQVQGSPFLSNYVKDAKSVTYEKNMFNSHIDEDKSRIHGQ